MLHLRDFEDAFICNILCIQFYIYIFWSVLMNLSKKYENYKMKRKEKIYMQQNKQLNIKKVAMQIIK